MEIYQLKVFLEVARRLNFTAAADVLNLTQPAVSAKIKSLESSLGTELFHRLGRKIELTAVGQHLLEAGPKLIGLENLLIQEINEIKQGKFSHLKVGCTEGVAQGWLPKFIFECRQKHPNIEIQCLVFKTVRSLYDAITLGNVELGFSETDLQEFNEVESFPVDQFCYHLTVAADHRLATCQWLSLKDLTSEPWVFPPPDTSERIILESRLEELGIPLSDFSRQEIAQTPSLAQTFLTQGYYLGFTSSFQFQTERRAKSLVAISLQEFALDLKLFMVMSKQVSQRVSSSFQQQGPEKRHTGSKKDACLSEPLKQFVQLILERAPESLHSKTKEAFRPHSQPSHDEEELTTAPTRREEPSDSTKNVYLQSPNISIRRLKVDSTDQLTLNIGTQNRTIQTVTAGIIIQKLGLLEHFLPREGRYSKTDYQIQWCDFTSGAPIVAGLQSQQLDIGILGDYPLLLSGLAGNTSAAAHTKLVSFVASNPDGAGNTIIVPDCSNFQCLNDLRSRVIAVPFGSAAHGMIMRNLSQEGLLQDVDLISIDNLSIHQLTPRNSRADGYAYFAPLHDIASHSGKFRRLQEENLNALPTFHGVVAGEKLVEQHPEVVIAYLKALIAAQNWYMTTPSALSLVSRWVQLDPEIVAKTLDYRQSNALGLFFPETQVRTDWITEHIQQLEIIPNNESIGKLKLGDWIQTDLLDRAMSSL